MTDTEIAVGTAPEIMIGTTVGIAKLIGTDDDEAVALRETIHWTEGRGVRERGLTVFPPDLDRLRAHPMHDVGKNRVVSIVEGIEILAVAVWIEIETGTETETESEIGTESEIEIVLDRETRKAREEMSGTLGEKRITSRIARVSTLVIQSLKRPTERPLKSRPREAAHQTKLNSKKHLARKIRARKLERR